MKIKSIFTALFVTALCASSPAHADWPNDKPIEIVVGFSPGGGTDIMARNLARFVEQKLGTSVFVSNKPGAGGAIAAAHIANAKPDGYTVGMVNVPGFIFLPLYRDTIYQPEELQLIARIVKDPIVVYSKRGSTVPSTLNEIIGHLAKDPESLSFGHSGDGTVGHIGLMQIQEETDVLGTAIPFKGGAETRSTLLGGHIDYALMTTGEVPDINDESSMFEALVLLSDDRMPHIDHVPTAQESGINVTMASERGLAGPRELSAEIAQRLESLVAEILQDPEFIAASTADAPVLDFLSGSEWSAQLDNDTETFRPLAEKIKSGQNQ